MNEKINVQNLLENNWRLKCCISKLQYHCEVYKLGLCSIHKILEGESKEGDKSVTRFSARGNCENKLILLSQRKALNKISGIIRKAKIFINGYSLLKDQEPVERISAQYNISIKRESSPNAQKQKRKNSSESKSFQGEYSAQITKTDAGNVNSKKGNIKREDTNTATSSSEFHRHVASQHLDILVHKNQHNEMKCANQQSKEEIEDKSGIKKEKCPNSKVSKSCSQIVDDGAQTKWKDINGNLHPPKFENKNFDNSAIKFGTTASDSEKQQTSRKMSKRNEFCGNRNKNMSFLGKPFISRPTTRQTTSIHKDEQLQKRSQVYKPRLSSSSNNNKNNVAHACYKATYSNKLRVWSESSRHGSEINRRWDSKRKQRNDVNIERFGQQNKRECWKKEEKRPTDEYQHGKVRRVDVYPENEGYYFGKAGKMVIRPHYSSDLADKRAQPLIQPQHKLYKSSNENPNAASTFASSPLKGIEIHSNTLGSDLITPNNKDNNEGIEKGGSATTPTFSNIPLIPEEDAGTYLPDPRLCKNRKKTNPHIII